MNEASKPGTPHLFGRKESMELAGAHRVLRALQPQAFPLTIGGLKPLGELPRTCRDVRKTPEEGAVMHLVQGRGQCGNHAVFKCLTFM